MPQQAELQSNHLLNYNDWPDTPPSQNGFAVYTESPYAQELFPPVTTEELTQMEHTLQELCMPGECAPMDKVSGLYMRDTYPPQLLQLLKEIYSDGMATPQVQSALEAIKRETQKIGYIAAQNNQSPAEAFSELVDQSFEGTTDTVGNFAKAKRLGVNSLAANQHLLPLDLQQQAATLIKECQEAEVGITFPQEFKDRLIDPNTQALVISLDFNSTFNVDESFPHPDLTAKAQRKMRIFADKFRQKYPEKQLYLTLNTGRPGMYIWGAAEAAFPPIPAVRKLAVAETGGVILDAGLESGGMQVAVENPQVWGTELNNIRTHLLAQIQNSNTVHIEPKLSMLSIRIAEGDEFQLVAHDGSVVTPDWINTQLAEYFSSTETQLDAEFQELTADLTRDIPEAVEFIEKAVTAYQNGNGEKKRALDELRETVATVRDEHTARMTAIASRLDMLRLMQHDGVLAANYNPTAGYVDIGHRDLNKYNTLTRHVCRELGITPDQLLYVQLGDSSTDILPVDQTGPGEVNDGADNAYLIAVENSNQKLKTAASRRGERGIQASRPSVLAAADMFTGLKNAI